MKPLLPLICSLAISAAAFGQDLYSEISTARNIYDFGKTESGAETERSIWTVNDSLVNIPAYDTYCSWNTTRVHPYQVKLTEMKDTVIIPLLRDTCSFVAPYVGRKTSDFGYRRYRYHYGVDIKLETGDEVKSAFEGVVRVAHYDGDYGKVVVVRHTNGLETLYAHLSKFKVREGDWVEAGDVVGLGGNTGRSTGSHLHFEARYLGEPIDPNVLIDWTSGELKMKTLYLNKEHFEYLVDIRKRKYYTIRRGDTLSGIARKYGTSIGQLCKLNGIRTSTTLRVGQKLRYN